VCLVDQPGNKHASRGCHHSRPWSKRYRGCRARAYRLSEIPMSRQFLVLSFSCERGKGVFISRLLLSQ
jgi:hypothetical protein